MRYGKAPWSEAWIRLIEAHADVRRLWRGRELWREERVLRLSVEPGRIVAGVQGSRSRPYDVLIDVPILEDDPFLRTLYLLTHARNALHHAFTQAPHLVPRYTDVEFVCSCPDWGDPCKHTVAVWLAFGDLIAREPEKLLLVRGIQEPASGRARRTAAEIADEADSVQSMPQAGAVSQGGYASAADGANKRSADLPGRSVYIKGREQLLTVDARAFWEGDGSWAEPPPTEAERGEERDATPGWVFVPPMPWPNKRPSYAEVMAHMYDIIRAAAKETPPTTHK